MNEKLEARCQVRGMRGPLVPERHSSRFGSFWSRKQQRSHGGAAWAVPGLSVAAAALALLVGQTASAQARFGDKTQLAITAENLFGYTSESYRYKLAPLPDDEHSVSRFNFLMNHHALGAVPSSVRVGAHFFVIPSLSLGGTIAIDSASHSHQEQSGVYRITRKDPTFTAFAFLPKVGYALMFSDKIGLWFRGGIGYASGSQENSPDSSASRTKVTDSYWLFSGDVLFVVSPVSNAGFYVGPGFDVSLTGSRDTTDPTGRVTSLSASYMRLALDTGLIAYFNL